MKRRWLCCFLLVFCLAGCGATQEAIDREQMLQEAAELHEDALQGVIDAQKNLQETFSGQSDVSSGNPNITVKLGETGSSENFNITFLDFWTQDEIIAGHGSGYLSSSDGYVYALIAIDIENCSSTVKEIFPSIDFVCYADNVLYDTNVSTVSFVDRIENYNYIGNDAGGITLQSGRILEGYYAFEIPADAETFEMEFDEFILTCDIPH